MNSTNRALREAELAVFGPNGPLLFETVRTVIRGMEHAPVRYRYISVEDHEALLNNDLCEGIRVQTVELLYHAHFAAVATLVRASRWAEGCLAAYSSDLFLPFCASARGLLEAVGDSFDALPQVPLSLAENHLTIKAALSSTSPPTLMNYKQIEDVLLHFSHAKRVDRGQRLEVPGYVPAKFPSEYTKPLEAYEPGGFYAWYQELCELAHPASDSVCYMLLPQNDGRLAFHPSIDRERIRAHIAVHQQRLTELLRLSQVPALVMLRVLSHIGPSELCVSTLRDIDISHIQLWKKCAAAMRVTP
jgi:hypothetical protein